MTRYVAIVRPIIDGLGHGVGLAKMMRSFVILSAAVILGGACTDPLALSDGDDGGSAGTSFGGSGGVGGSGGGGMGGDVGGQGGRNTGQFSTDFLCPDSVVQPDGGWRRLWRVSIFH